MIGPPERERLVDDLGRLDEQALVEVRRRGWRASGRPRGSSGRRAGTPSRTRRSSARGSVAAARTARPPRPCSARATQTRRRFRRAWAARSGARRYQRSPAAIGEADLRTFGQVAGQPRRGDQGLRADAAAEAAHPARPGIHGASPGPGSGRPACMTARPSLELVALLGGRRPDRLEAVPLLRRRADRDLERVGDRLGRALDRRRIGRRHLDGLRPGQLERVVGLAPDRDRQDQRAGLGGERRGAGGQRGPGVEEVDRDAVGAIAPVDEEGEHLAPAQHAEDLAEVAPRDDRTPRAARAPRAGARRAPGTRSRRRPR